MNSHICTFIPLIIFLTCKLCFPLLKLLQKLPDFQHLTQFFGIPCLLKQHHQTQRVSPNQIQLLFEHLLFYHYSILKEMLPCWGNANKKFNCKCGLVITVQLNLWFNRCDFFTFNLRHINYNMAIGKIALETFWHSWQGNILRGPKQKFLKLHECEHLKLEKQCFCGFGRDWQWH